MVVEDACVLTVEEHDRLVIFVGPTMPFKYWNLCKELLQDGVRFRPQTLKPGADY